MEGSAHSASKRSRLGPSVNERCSQQREGTEGESKRVPSRAMDRVHDPGTDLRFDRHRESCGTPPEQDERGDDHIVARERFGVEL